MLSFVLALGLANAPAVAQADKPTFDDAARAISVKLDDSLAELSKLRQEIAASKLPLNRALSELEGELLRMRSEYQDASRLLDTRTLDLSNLATEIKQREEEADYLTGILGEYLRNLESGLHIAELGRYADAIDAAKLAPDNDALSAEEQYAAQTALLATSLDRLHDALGGTTFEGTARNADGIMKTGTFVLVGPAAIFRPQDGSSVGTAEQRLGSLVPAEIAFPDPSHGAVAAELVTRSTGSFPLDPTLGNAHKVAAATQETFLEHVQKGGNVMIPIFAMAAAALLVALFKWFGMAFVFTPSKKKVNTLLDAVAKRDVELAQSRVHAIGGPVGRMLKAGVEHLEEPRELIEEVMYETVLTTKLKLQRFLPFIAICAASAPLLGLLGTVTGIISTFKLITVFGSGDVKVLSGGISEALITTKFGLIVAIPSLLLHAFLSRKARGIVSKMETTAIAFVNQVSKTPLRAQSARQPVSANGTLQPAAPDADLVKARVNEILADLLTSVSEDDEREHPGARADAALAAATTSTSAEG